MRPLSILTVPAFDDNYLWIIHDGVSAAVVDPGDDEAILASLAAHQLQLTAILLTHHHGDHIGGVSNLLRHRQVPVYGPVRPEMPVSTVAVHQSQEIVIPSLDWRLTVLEVPGHTRDHLAYFAPDQHWLFCGDTLFAGGCGRLFEGSAEQMLASLDQISQLPDDTMIYCAHEYTLSNLRFAQMIEPRNEALAQRAQEAKALREQGKPTVPSTLALEKATNPFLRVREASVQETLRKTGKLSSQPKPIGASCTFAALRLWKNEFR